MAVLHWSRPWLATKQPQAERRLMLNEARLASQQRAEAAKGEAVKALQVRRKTEKTSMSCFGPASVLLWSWVKGRKAWVAENLMVRVVSSSSPQRVYPAARHCKRLSWTMSSLSWTGVQQSCCWSPSMWILSTLRDYGILWNLMNMKMCKRLLLLDSVSISSWSRTQCTLCMTQCKPKAPGD